MGLIKEALTFDDVTLAPNYSEILPSEVSTHTKLSKNLNLKIPLPFLEIPAHLTRKSHDLYQN